MTTGLSAYSKSKDGGFRLSKNFVVKEFACKDGSDVILVHPTLVIILQGIRDKFGVPVTINSAYRTVTHNRKEGGKMFSQHLYGTAADIVVKGVDPIEVARYAHKVMQGFGGVGLYPNFTHIDVRGSYARWDTRSGVEKSVNNFN